MPEAIDRYQLAPDDPRQLAEQLRDIVRRLGELERRNPMAAGARVRDGLVIFTDEANNVVIRIDLDGLTMFDVDGDRRLRIGRLEGGQYGLQVLDAAGFLERIRVDERGLLYPYFHSAFVPRQALAFANYTEVTSATFIPIYTSKIGQVSHQAVSVEVTCTTDVGTTGEFRLKATGGATTDAVTVPSGSAGTMQVFEWLHGLLLGSGPVYFDVEARRTSGTGNLYVFVPYDLILRAPTIGVADGIP